VARSFLRCTVSDILCGSVLQWIAVGCNVVQYVAVCCSLLQSVAVCCSSFIERQRSMMQYVAVCCSTLQHVVLTAYRAFLMEYTDLLIEYRTFLKKMEYRTCQIPSECCSVLQCVAVCCSVEYRACQIPSEPTCDW